MSNIRFIFNFSELFLFLFWPLNLLGRFIWKYQKAITITIHTEVSNISSSLRMKPEPPWRLLGQIESHRMSLGGKTVVCVLWGKISDEYRLSQCAPLILKRLAVCNRFIALAAKDCKLEPGLPVRQIRCHVSVWNIRTVPNLDETNRKINMSIQ